MDPLVAEFPNRTWYSGRLLNGPRASAPAAVRAALHAVAWPAGRAHPVAFVDVLHGAEETSASGSKINRSEASAVVQCLRALHRRSPALAAQRGAVAVLTSYTAQRTLIESEARRAGALRGGSVVVSTVDAFQGQEANIVLLSLVRSNSRGCVGFQAEWRRFNVALTRARDALIVFGNSPTLLLGRSAAVGGAGEAAAAEAAAAAAAGATAAARLGAVGSWVRWAEGAGLRVEARPEEEEWVIPCWINTDMVLGQAA